MPRLPAPKPLAGVDTKNDVATTLRTSSKHITFLLYGRPENLRYVPFTIPKRSGGNRSILAPKNDLKCLQSRLADILAGIYNPRDASHGFIKDRSILSNAANHLKCRHVLNVDLRDFFPSINYGRVRGLFLALGCSPKAATILAHLSSHKNELPQGSPSSPIISNMICARLDRQLHKLAKAHHCRYSRYADDLSISKRTGCFPVDLAYFDEADKRTVLGKPLRDIIESNGFAPHPGKTWLFTRQHRQMVTGLVVNSKLNVPRDFVLQLRGMINAWAKFGLQAAQSEYHGKHCRSHKADGSAPPFDKVVLGKMEFLKMVKGSPDMVYKGVQQRLVIADPNYLDIMKQENDSMKKRDVFISHAYEDKADVAKELADSLIAEGITVWYDEYSVQLGDDLLHKIDEGLVHSQYGVIIFSPNFFKAKKTWTFREYSGLVAGEDADKTKRIIPIWHNISKEELTQKSPTIANRYALLSKQMTPADMAIKIAQHVKKS